MSLELILWFLSNVYSMWLEHFLRILLSMDHRKTWEICNHLLHKCVLTSTNAWLWWWHYNLLHCEFPKLLTQYSWVVYEELLEMLLYILCANRVIWDIFLTIVVGWMEWSADFKGSNQIDNLFKRVWTLNRWLVKKLLKTQYVLKQIYRREDLNIPKSKMFASNPACFF